MHHMQIVKYPPETREKLLTEAEEIGLTTRQVRKAAEELHGTNEREDVLKRHLVSVYLWPERMSVSAILRTATTSARIGL